MTAQPPVTLCSPAERLTALPMYVFAWLDELKAAARARGAEFVDLGMGNPDQPTPAPIVEAIARAYADPATHGYPPFRGSPEFRQAVVRFMQRRYGVALDAEREVLCVSGAKEGIAQLSIAFTDEQSISLVPDIYYPVHARATMLAGGSVHPLPLREDEGFLPRFDGIPDEVLRRSHLLIVNYPHNPTGAVAPREFYERAVAFCQRHGIVLVSDAAYAELTFDGVRSPSVFEIPGAREVAVEFHSFSKSFNMAGSRIGFVVGNPELIDILHAVRTNMGYGTPVPIQAGAAYALDHAEELTAPIARRYEARRDALMESFRALGWPCRPPGGTMFAWLPVPRGFTSQRWTEHLLDTAGVVVTPGNAFGPGGEGFFRVSLIREPDELRRAVERIGAAGVRYA